MRRSGLLSWVLAAVTSTACVAGETGERGRVHFSLNMDFAEASDFSNALAVGRPVWVTPENPPPQPGVAGQFYTGVSLRLHADGEPESAAQPLPQRDGATWLLEIDRPGAWWLLAVDEAGEVVDRVAVRSREMAALRLSSFYKVSAESPEEGCGGVSSRSKGVQDFVLHRNQAVILHAVPLDQDGQPLIGLLELQVIAPDFLNAVTMNQKPLAPANAVRVAPFKGVPLGEAAEVLVREGADGPSFTHTLRTKDADGCS